MSAYTLLLFHVQKYDASKNEYMFRDKYYGRSLSEAGFQQELQSFLHDGVRFRAELLPNIIAMLKELVKVIQRQDSYRFYSTSLLIMYDGAQGEWPSNSATNGITDNSEECGFPTTNGFIDSSKECGISVSNGIADGSKTLTEDRYQQQTIEKYLPQSLSEMRTSVDMRIIDFNKSTHAGYNDKVQYSGPDTGFLLGLHSLLDVFSQMLKSDS